jgi:hypothetical protein
MVTRPRGLGQFPNARDVRAQEFSRQRNPRARIIDVNASGQRRSVKLPVDGLNQLRDVVSVLARHEFCGQEADQIK